MQKSIAAFLTTGAGAAAYFGWGVPPEYTTAAVTLASTLLVYLVPNKG
ncbi:MAG: hypothetical protein GDA50_02065 [Alphaproteobacteria bacterium GM202ARS2]|nr:hypothetical protein [Alphaproteobacteria bacterium GM202ARS2]